MSINGHVGAALSPLRGKETYIYYFTYTNDSNARMPAVGSIEYPVPAVVSILLLLLSAGFCVNIASNVWAIFEAGIPGEQHEWN